MRGLGQMIKRRKIFRYLQEEQIDIAFIQESHTSKNKERMYKNEWGGRIIFDHGETNARGVCILISKKLDLKITKIWKSHEGRCILAEATFDDQKLLFGNIYAPNADNPEFFNAILNRIVEIEVDYKIIGGDFNIVLDEKLDRKRIHKATTYKSKSAEKLNSFLEEQEWVDIWRVLHENKFQYTWKRTNPLIMSRLDYFLIPQHTVGNVVSYKITSSIESDYLFVKMELEFVNMIRGRGFWKMNNSHLTNKTYVDEVNEILDYAEYRYDALSKSLKW